MFDATTVFDEFRKKMVQTRKKVTGNAVILEKIKGECVWGYEIQVGCYLHGLFWNENLLKAICSHLGLRFRKLGVGLADFQIWLRIFDVDFIPSTLLNNLLLFFI